MQMVKSYTGWYAAGALLMATAAGAQTVETRQTAIFVNDGGGAQVIDVSSADDVPPTAGQPFSAEATTELVQVLADGNRIERRFTTSLARDSKGRTRREQEIALIGPLRVLTRGSAPAAEAGGPPPRFVIITDPVAGASVTLDERAKVARRMKTRGAGRPVQLFLGAGPDAPIGLPALPMPPMGGPSGDVVFHAAAAARAVAPDARTESLGTAEIEGVTAEGTRTTVTIPAGEVGNLLPIEIVTERWFSPELQMAVRITRRDPRTGESTYRLTNLSRTEPLADLFAVPAEYQIVDAVPPPPPGPITRRPPDPGR